MDEAGKDTMGRAEGRGVSSTEDQRSTASREATIKEASEEIATVQTAENNAIGAVAEGDEMVVARSSTPAA